MTNIPSGHDPHDERFDASLRAAAKGMTIPPEPAAAQVARWRSGADADVHGAGRAGVPRGRRRMFAGMSAAAAMIAVAAAAFFGLPVSRPVQAGTILSSLRAASVTGFRVTLMELRGNGATLDGELEVHFPRAIALEKLLDEHGHDDLPEPSAVVMKVDLAMGDEAVVPGLRALAAGAITDESTWFYARSSEIPAEIMESGKVPPVAMVVSGFLRGGMMVDLGAGVPGKLDAEQAGDRAEHGRRAMEIGLDADRGEVQARIRERHARHRARKVEIEKYVPQIRALLAGDAGAADLEDIRKLLQKHAAKEGGGATVHALGNGRYMLVAAGPGDDGQIGMMRIAYAQGAGVEWVEFSRIEGLRGAVRIDLLTSPMDPAKADKAKWIEEGKTMLISPEMIEQWMPMLGFPASPKGGKTGRPAGMPKRDEAPPVDPNAA
ncbi:MAG: hypothetical protein AB7K52_14760 [Phycisphaerales bacterium]